MKSIRLVTSTSDDSTPSGKVLVGRMMMSISFGFNSEWVSICYTPAWDDGQYASAACKELGHGTALAYGRIGNQQVYKLVNNSPFLKTNATCDNKPFWICWDNPRYVNDACQEEDLVVVECSALGEECSLCEVLRENI